MVHIADYEGIVGYLTYVWRPLDTLENANGQKPYRR